MHDEQKRKLSSVMDLRITHSKNDRWMNDEWMIYLSRGWMNLEE